jgi:hypothetical protein
MLSLGITAIKHAARRASESLGRVNATMAQKVAPILKNVASALEGESVDILKTEKLAKSIDNATFAFYIGLGVFIASFLIFLMCRKSTDRIKQQ